MSRPPKPTELLELGGAFEKNPNRRRAPVAKSTKPFGRPPSYFAPDEADVWREIASNAAAGVLTAADRLTVEPLCLLIAKMRRREEMKGNEIAIIQRGLGSLGMSPSDRTRISLDSPTPSKPGSPVVSRYSEFLSAPKH